MTDLSAMTTNERLLTAGLLEAWDDAVKGKDRDGMIEVLTKVQASDPERIADITLANPERYGF